MDALKKITEGMTGQESAQIIYQNDVNSLTDYIVSYLHPTEGENGTNVYTLNTAVAKIPQDIRKEGMTCTFLSEEGWRSYKYIGATIDGEDWNVTDNWIAVVTEKELSNINEEVENLQRDMDNAFTQNGFIWTFAGTKVAIVFKDNGNTSIAFPEQTVISYGNTSVICDMGISMIEVPAATKNLYLVFNISKGKVEVVTAQNQMNGTVLLGWISNEVKTAFLKCSEYTVNGKSMNPANYLLASDIVDGLISTSVDKPLSANMGRILSTQNGMMEVISTNKSVNVDFSDTDISVTISLPPGLYLSYGNTRITDSATTNGQVIADPMTAGKLRYLVYDLNETQYKLTDSMNQMTNSVLVGWINQYFKEAILRCNNYFVNGVSRSFRNYIPKSNIAHDLITSDVNKVLGADQAAILATQNGWLFPRNKGGIRFENIGTTGMSLTINGRYSVSWGNTVVSNDDDTSQKVISASDVYSTMYLIYHIDNDTFTWEKAANQMRGNVLLGWYNYVTDKVYLNCDEYTINGMPASNYDLAEIAYNNIPTTVIQLKKYADGGHLNINMTSSIDTEVKITGGRVSFDPTDFRESSVNIRKGIATNLYFRCVEPYAVIEAKGVYALSSDSQFSNSYVSQNIRDFGKGVTQLIFQYNNNISGNIYDIPRDVNYLAIGNASISENTLKGIFSDLPRLMTYLRITSSKAEISGDVADLPRKLTFLYLNTSSANNIAGNVVDLPRSLEHIQVYGLTDKFTGNVVDLPRALTILSLSGVNYIISGAVTDLPPNLTIVSILGASVVSGNISELPRKITTLLFLGNCNIAGSLADLPTSSTEISIQSTDTANPIVGDISNVPNKNVILFRLRQNFNITFNGEFPLSDQLYFFELRPSETFPIDSATVDNILIKLASIAGERTGTRTLNLVGSCAAPTEASQAAIASLQQKGFTVQTN
ncbi:hypothetical protein [Bacteroides nordii]|uniref:Uncharacterized protein n=1 Tax=Bacteroides nordii CL02T12C05 TaxID=997884 RepID=I9RXJ9_9BACE|nr:hypothetical protein [Bacteroides nordii]EIY47553.1 hypothetical protein HMPREF1068_03203 [Bacteroides nordii CL02T12C05]